MKGLRERERQGASGGERAGQSGAGVAPATCKKPYVSPRLECYGDLRTLTLGGSPGLGDSGSAFIEQP